MRSKVAVRMEFLVFTGETFLKLSSFQINKFIDRRQNYQELFLDEYNREPSFPWKIVVKKVFFQVLFELHRFQQQNFV